MKWAVLLGMNNLNPYPPNPNEDWLALCNSIMFFGGRGWGRGSWCLKNVGSVCDAKVTQLILPGIVGAVVILS